MSSLSASRKFNNPLASMGGPGPVVASRSGAQESASSQADQSAEFMQSPEMGMISSLIQALTQGSQQGGSQQGESQQGESPQAAPQGKLQSAAGEIAQDEAGRGTLNGDQMRNLANGKSVDGLGTDSAQEQQAAAYIMGGQKGASGESKRWEKIETADVGGADNLSSLGNFSTIAAQPKMTETSAAGEIAQDEAGRGTLNGQQMHNLASGKGADGTGTDSAQEQRAAAYLMGGPKGASGESKRWEKIETADVGGADNLSSLANFKNIAAQGDQKAAGSQDDGQTADLLKLIGDLQAKEPMLHGLSQGLGGMGGQVSSTMTQSLQQLMAQQEKTLKSIMGSDD